MQAFLEVIKAKYFKFLWFGQITSQISLNMLIFVLAIKVYELTASNAAVSFLMLAFGIPAIIFGIIAGSIVDEFDKRKILILCNFVRCVIIFLFFIFPDNLIILYFLSVLAAVFTQLFIPAEAPSIPSLVKQNLLLTANSLFNISFYLATVMGFVLSGPFLSVFGHQNIYLIMSFFMLLATISVYLLPPLLPEKRERSSLFDFKALKNKTIEGFSFIHKNSRIKQSLILMTFSQALITTLAVLTPGFADKILGIQLTDASYLVMGPAAVGLILGSILVGGYGAYMLKSTIIVTGVLFAGIGLVILPLVSVFEPLIVSSISAINNLTVTIFILFLLGIFNSFITVPANTILQEDAGHDHRGRVYGVLTALIGGASFLPVIFSGILADVVGVRLTLLVLGVIVMLIGVYQFRQRKVKFNFTKK